MSSSANGIALVGDRVARKFMAFFGQGGLLERTPEHALTLYGLMRLGDFAAFVDRELAAFLFAGPLPGGEFQCLGMGGPAGAFRLVQGHYLRRTSGRELLRRHVDLLLAEHPRVDGFFGLPAPSGLGTRAESLLMVCPFLAMSGLVLKDDALFKEAIDQYLAGEALLRDASNGLFHHAAHWHSSGQAVPAAWIRASGSAVAALTETLRYVPELHPRRGLLIARLVALLERLLPLQAPSGLWRQQLDDPSAAEESSGSALIAMGLAVALARAWLPAQHERAAWRAWAGLTTCIETGKRGNISRVCVDTEPGDRRAYYRDRPQALNDPHGFGPLILAACAFFELVRKRMWMRRSGPIRSFPQLSGHEAAEGFAGAHRLCEVRYNGDGSWGRGTQDFPLKWAGLNSESYGPHPLLRDAGYCVMGYLGALRSRPEKIYRMRARQGLDGLLRNQEPDGSFRLYTRRREGQTDHNGCLFVSGVAGAALAKGYEDLGDDRCLEGSARLAQWEMEWPVVRNVNFNAFAVWHLAEHYRLTGDPAARDAALHKCTWGLMAHQQTSGGWGGHNSWIWYHAFNLRAYAALLKALPADHPFHGDLRPATLAAVDYLAALQQPDGSMHPNPETNRPRAAEYAMAALALLAAFDDDARAPEILSGAVRYLLSSGENPANDYNDERHVTFKGTNAPVVLYALGSYLRLAGRS